MPAPVDPSWLASTVAQSTAALVGIVGGLLVGRFVGLDSEQRVAQLRLTDARERRDAARAERDELASQRVATAAEGVIENRDVTARLVATSGDLSAAQVLAMPEVHTWLSEAELGPHLADAAAAVQQAFSVLNEKLGETEEPAHAWDRVRSAYGLPYNRWNDLREAVYDNVVEQKRRSAAEARKQRERNEELARRRREGLGGVAGALAGLNLGAGFTPNFRPVASVLPIMSASRVRPSTPTVSLRQRLGDAETKLRAAELEVTQAERAVQAAQAPPGLLVAVSVLTMLTLLGLVWPVWVLYAEPTDDSSGRRLAVLAAFAAGLLLLLVYLWGYTWRLSRGSNDEPKTPAAGQ